MHRGISILDAFIKRWQLAAIKVNCVWSPLHGSSGVWSTRQQWQSIYSLLITGHWQYWVCTGYMHMSSSYDDDYLSSCMSKHVYWFTSELLVDERKNTQLDQMMKVEEPLVFFQKLLQDLHKLLYVLSFDL